MNNFLKNDQQDNDDDNHFFDVQALSSEDLDAIAGGYPCSYLGVYDYTKMVSYASRNYSC
jgi:hypothetical protein